MTCRPLEYRVRLAGTTTYTAGDVWGFDGTGPAIKAWQAVSGISGNAFSYSVPALSAAHMVLR